MVINNRPHHMLLLVAATLTTRERQGRWPVVHILPHTFAMTTFRLGKVLTVYQLIPKMKIYLVL